MFSFRTVVKAILSVCLVLTGCLANAETVDQEDAQKVARNFMKRSFSRTDNVTNVITFDSLGITTMYAFNFEGGGYVLISGSYSADPILAYSNSDIFMPKDSISNNGLLEFLNDCNIIILNEEKMSEKTRGIEGSESEKKWNEWFSEKESIPAFGDEDPVWEVKDLLYDSLRGGSVKWNQSGCEGVVETYNKDTKTWVSNNVNNIRYNEKMPSIENCSEHGYAGCVPVSIGQVMWKWKWPLSVAYTHEEREGQDTILKNYVSTYDWDSMPSRLLATSSVRNMNEISTLLRDCGYMLKADYQCGGTSAYTSNVCDILIRKNLIDYNCYGVVYTDSCYNRKRSQSENTYSISDFTKLIVTELIAGRPVVMGATYWINESRYYGHGYVVSGFQRNIDGYYFYINYGWSGHYDSYYNMDFTHTPQNKGERYAYTNDKKAVIGISPRKGNESGDHNIVAECQTSTISSDGIGKLRFYVKNANSYIVKIKYLKKEYPTKYNIQIKNGQKSYVDCVYKEHDEIIARNAGNIINDGLVELWYGTGVSLQNKYETLCETFEMPTEYEISFLNNYGQVETYNGLFVEENDDMTNNEDYLTENQISISPNPSSGIFIVNSYFETIEHLSISNISGVTIREVNSIRGLHGTLDLSDLSAGCYFVTVTTEKSRIVKKIIKK